MRDAVEAQKYNAFATTLFEKRKARMQRDPRASGDGGNDDLMAHLLQSNSLSDGDLQADSSLLVAAGSDAVRLAIAAAIFYLLKNPPVLDKITKEIRASVLSADEITDSILSRIKYLRACVNEALRLTPPKAASIPREVREGGITIDGMYIPRGMTVGISVYSLHHNPDIFPDPYAFRPERWLEAKDDHIMQAAFCPLLKGPRMCPGGMIAYFAVELALFHLMYLYDLRFAPGGNDHGGMSDSSDLRQRRDEYQMNDWIIGFAMGPEIECRRHVV
ncbi:hypothetical protein LTR08_005728 [Meristemomyces frigidus]|nr:hypothetical protein LTR08_005728 [Meristemomyces frigidus]